MKITEINCPHCCADIPYKDGQSEIKFCIYCGGVLDLKLDITGNIIDETANAEALYEKRIADEEELARKNYVIRIKKWRKRIIISYIIGYLMIALNIHNPQNPSPFSVFAVVAGMFFLLAIIPIFFLTCPKPPYKTEKPLYFLSKFSLLFTEPISVIVCGLAFGTGAMIDHLIEFFS